MIEVIIRGRQDEAQDICSFELVAADGAALPAFEPGAHIDVHLDGGIVRQYSLCPPPESAGRYQIGVLREPASRGGSAAMHSLQPGKRLRISPPRNHFPLVRDARRSLLFAGGIGITPLLAMAEQLAAQRRDFVLHYCVRSRARMAFAERIGGELLAANARCHFDAGAPSERLNLDSAIGPPDTGTHLYVCGPPGFMGWVLAGARALGWPEAQLHKEYFAAPAQAGLPESAFELRLARSGRSLDVPVGRRVIDVLAEHGIEVPVSCEQGVCGTCLTRVVDGTPDHRDTFLTDEERARNDCFTPCCSRSRSPRLVLDL